MLLGSFMRVAKHIGFVLRRTSGTVAENGHPPVSFASPLENVTLATSFKVMWKFTRYGPGRPAIQS
jgi:hypothetical protein